MRRALLVPALLLPLLLADCGGGGGSGEVLGPPPTAAPRNLTYAVASAAYALESPITTNTPSWEGGDPLTFTVTPDLPAGLALDAGTGAISGTTTTTLAPRRTYTVTAANAGGAATAALEIVVGPLETLAAGFQAERVAASLATPVRMAVLPDGRILYNELESGDTRVMDPDGTIQPVPFAHTDVVTGGHRGLLGLTLHPDYASNGWVYVAACAPGTMTTPDRIVVRRFTAAELTPGVLEGTNAATIVDNLPIAVINNSGDLAFDHSTPSPRLFVSVGDTDDEMKAQQIGGLAGRILRFTDDGAVPADNPTSGDPTLCLGLRNTFALAVQPTTGDLWGADNGPASNDELNFLRAGKNFEWGGLPPSAPPGDVGIRVTGWLDVIVPTAMAWHDGRGWGTAYADDLFLTSYADEAVRRIRVSGLSFLDVDEEILFATFRPGGVANKPLDVEVEADGSLLVSTFTAIYRIRQAP